MADRRRCDSCGVPLPPSAARCPSCGHGQGDVVTVEIGRPRRGGGRRRDGLLLAAVAVVVVGALAFAARTDDGGSEAAQDEASDEWSDTTTTTERRRSTTSRPTTTSAPLGQLLLGQPTNVRLLVSRAGSRFSVVDLDSGSVQPITGIGEGRHVIADASGFWAAGGSQPQYFAAPYDRDPQRFEDLPGGGGMLFESATPGRMWYASYGDEPQVVELDATGAVTAGPVPTPFFGQVFAVDGGLVVGLRGGIYVMNLDDGSQRRVGTGEAIAARGSLVAAISCDDIADCSLQVIDTQTEQSRILDVRGADFNDRYYIATFSPDGAMLVLVGNTPNDPTPVSVTVVDVERDVVVPIEIDLRPQASCCGLPVSWSLDSQWLFWAGGDVVHAWQRGTDEPIRFSPGVAPFSSVFVVG